MLQASSLPSLSSSFPAPHSPSGFGPKSVLVWESEQLLAFSSPPPVSRVCALSSLLPAPHRALLTPRQSPGEPWCHGLRSRSPGLSLAGVSRSRVRGFHSSVSLQQLAETNVIAVKHPRGLLWVGRRWGRGHRQNHEENHFCALKVFFTSETAPLQSWPRLVGNTEGAHLYFGHGRERVTAFRKLSWRRSCLNWALKHTGAFREHRGWGGHGKCASCWEILGPQQCGPALCPGFPMPSAMMKNQQEWRSAPSVDGRQGQHSGTHERRHSAVTEEPNEALL